MSSLHKRVIINTRERAVSDDINQAQTFVAQTHQETLRALYGDRRMAPSRAYPGVTAPYPSPIPANTCPHDVFTGLMVRPDLGASLLIDPGTVGYNSPGQGGVDDSNYIITRSEGVTSTGVLTFTANGGGSTRIDIVECQPQEILTQTSSRDIYDPITGLFTPAIVEKVRESRLTFRIVTGGASGIRNINSSWIPLAVIFVPPGAAGFTQCDVFDVRPLVEDRIPHMDNRTPIGGGVAVTTSNQGSVTVLRCMRLGVDAESAQRLSGYFESDFNGYLAGGDIRKNCPTSLANFGTGDASGAGDDDYFSLTDTLNIFTDVAATTPADVLPILACFPGGYPRWVRYSQLPVAQSDTAGVHLTGRIPKGARGILMVGASSLVLNNGAASISPGVWPTNTGLHLGSTNIPGIVIAYCKQNVSTRRAPIGSLSAGFHFPDLDNVTITEGGDTGLDVDLGTYGGGTGTRLDIELAQGAEGVPRNATAVLVRMTATLNVAAPWAMKTFQAVAYCSSISNRAIPIVSGSYGWTNDDATGLMTVHWTGWVPLWELTPPDSTSGTTVTVLSLLMTHNSSDVTSLFSSLATVSGYRLD
jgi:hypothetical protein